MNWRNLSIPEAIQRLIEQRAGQVSQRTLAVWNEICRRLAPFFKSKKLRDLTIDDLERFQQHRRAEGKASATINQELGLTRQLLKRAHLWSRFADLYKPIQRTEPRRGMALSQTGQADLLRIASSRPEWADVRDAMLLAFCGGLRTVEIRYLRWTDLDLPNRSVLITRSKTHAGQRQMILNDALYDCLQRRLSKAIKKRWYLPEGFIFPAVRLDKTLDPLMPRKRFSSAWASIRKAAGFPTLRLHDGRHTAITTLIEAGIPEGVIRAHAGHVDPSMIAAYSHVRRQALEKAALALQPSTPKKSGQTLPTPAARRIAKHAQPTRNSSKRASRRG